MAWAQRDEPAAPTVRFDHLDIWKMAVEGGAQATLQPTRAQNVWNRPVARLRYRGEGKAEGKTRVFLIPPQPIELPGDADAVDMWVYGNRWDWEKPPGTPPVRLVLQLRDSRNEAHEFPVDSVRWQEWWLAHKKLPAGLPPPLRPESIEVSGGWQTEWREIFLDSVRFYREDLRPLQFAAHPRRNLKLPGGQSPGANIGPGKLPFPTREQTILPPHLSGGYRNRLEFVSSSECYLFAYRGRDCSVTYCLDPRKGLSSLGA